MRGGGPGRARAYLLRLRPPLRARPSRRPQSRHPPRVRGPPRRRARPGRRRPRTSHPAASAPSPPRGRCGSRSAPVAWPPPTSPPTACGRTRTIAGARSTPCEPWRCGCASDRREEWPHLLLMLGDQVYADEVSPGDRRVRRVASRHRGAAGHACARLRGVRAAVPRELVRAGDSLAPLHRVHGHDLRRPRRARRLEHLRRPGWRRCAQTDWWDEHVVAGLMSYWVYQHLGNLRAGGPSRPRAAPAGEGGGRRGGGPGRVRVSRRPADRRQPVELLPRRGRHAHRGRGLARRAGAGGGPALDGRRRRSGTGSPSTPRGTWTTC